MAGTGKLRLDKYLWAIRLYKTRALASAACEGGKVKYNGGQAKPSKNVTIGDEFDVKTEAKKWKIKVTALLHNRVKYEEAVSYYIDITPAEEIERLQYLKESRVQAASFHTGKRRSKIGRPTKKDRRDMKDFIED